MKVCPCFYSTRTNCDKCYQSSGHIPENKIEEIQIDLALLRDAVEALPKK